MSSDMAVEPLTAKPGGANQRTLAMQISMLLDLHRHRRLHATASYAARYERHRQFENYLKYQCSASPYENPPRRISNGVLVE